MLFRTKIKPKEQKRMRRYRAKLRTATTTIGAEEARSRAARLIKLNEKLFRRLA